MEQYLTCPLDGKVFVTDTNNPGLTRKAEDAYNDHCKAVEEKLAKKVGRPLTERELITGQPEFKRPDDRTNEQKFKDAEWKPILKDSGHPYDDQIAELLEAEEDLSGLTRKQRLARYMQDIRAREMKAEPPKPANERLRKLKKLRDDLKWDGSRSESDWQRLNQAIQQFETEGYDPVIADVLYRQVMENERNYYQAVRDAKQEEKDALLGEVAELDSEIAKLPIPDGNTVVQQGLNLWRAMLDKDAPEDDRDRLRQAVDSEDDSAINECIEEFCV